MAELIPFDAKLPTALSAVLGGADSNDDLSSGVSGGFSVISFRGSKWRVKHSGEETLLTDKGTGDPIASIRLVMLKANKHVSKNYYEGGYVEGSTDSPSCFSIDGDKPDSSAEHPQHDNCAGCPKNKFGSRITDTGTKAKACSDSRRIAVVPEGDYENAEFGGPMLLRVPAASLTDLASFGKAMKAKGYPYNTIVTKVGFDPDTSYPKLKFSAVRPLNGDEAGELAGLVQTDEYRQKLDYILATPVEVEVPKEAPVAAAPVAAKKVDPTEFEEPPAPVAAVKAAAPKAKAKDKASEADMLSDDLDDILAKLDGLE